MRDPPGGGRGEGERATAEEPIFKSYELHAKRDVTRSVKLERFLRGIKCIEDRSLTVVRLPPESER